MSQVAEPSVWLFDGQDPGRDLPAAEAAQVESMALTYDEPIWAPLPDTAVEAVTELFRGFYAHTPYRQIAAIEREDEYTVALHAEHRESNRDDWDPHVHATHAAEMQETLSDYFGPLWRASREASDNGTGTVHIHRVVGRKFHYREADQ
ncbi:MAG: hypothetical protein ACQEQJ_07965 [Halobacteriota archaeon]